MNALKTRIGMVGLTILALTALPAATAMAHDHGGRSSRSGRSGSVSVEYHHRSTGSYQPPPSLRRDDYRSHPGRFVPPPPAPSYRAVPGRYEVRTERVLVRDGYFVTRTERVMVESGRWETVWVPAVSETRRDHRGRVYTVVVRPGRYEQVWVPPRYEMRTVRQWVPPQYETRTVQVLVSGHCTSAPSSSRSTINIGGSISW